MRFKIIVDDPYINCKSEVTNFQGIIWQGNEYLVR